MPIDRLAARGRVGAGARGGDSLSWTLVEPDAGTTVYTRASSPYASRFRAGAVLFPRMLIFVETDDPRPLQPTTSIAVRSRRGRLDKAPWKDLPDQTGVVESIFVRPAYLGEHCLPFRMKAAGKVVIPFEGSTQLGGSDERIDRYPGLADWWRRAERVWLEHRSSDKRTLGEQIDYMKQLSAQFPTPDIRVVYTASGNTLAAAVVTDPQAVVEHKLYWCAASSLNEAHYLSAVLNSPALGKIVAPYQSRGAFGARDFDKYVWYPPIPEYDGSVPEHRELAHVGLQAQELAAKVPVLGASTFQEARRMTRDELRRAGLLSKADELLKALLTG